MPGTRLTKPIIDKIIAPNPSGKQIIIWDTELKGFGVLVSGTTKSISYVVQRRMPDGRTRRVTVGAISEFARVEDARRRGGEILAELRQGRDPQEERRAARARNHTLRESLDAYLVGKKGLKPRSAANYRQAVEQHLGGWLNKPLRSITMTMVENRHREIGQKAGEGAANATMRVLRALWNRAAKRDSSLPSNPVKSALSDGGWYALAPRERSVPADKLAKFYNGVDSLESRTGRDYLLLLLFTGLRRNEAAKLKWSEVDFDLGVIRLPASMTKAGRKLDLPMSNFVFDLLKSRRELGIEGEYVFSANSKSRHLEEPKFYLECVAEKTGITVSAHDLRRTFITIAESSDISPIALKALVNHALGHDVTSGYIQMTVERLREPAQKVCDKMMKLCRIELPEAIAAE